MGNIIGNGCYYNQNGLTRGDSLRAETEAINKLTTLLVEDYAKTRAAYMGLPTAEAKQALLAVFDLSEDELLMGPWKMEMVLALIDEEEAQEKLSSLQALIALHSTTEAR